MKKILLFCLLFVVLNVVGTANATIIAVKAFDNSSSGGIGKDTGLFINAGDQLDISVSATDLWSAGALPRWSDADGLDGDLFATGSDESGESAGTKIGQAFGLHTQHGHSFHYGSLVGELAGNWFKVGTSFSSAAPATGMLKLYYWDSNHFDNSGEISANINVHVPEPTSLALIGLGLAGIGFARRKKLAK